MSNLKLIPVEMLQIIPSYNGDRRLLNFYLKKCEYVYEKYKGDDEQNVYVMHAITSRLTENAAALVSDNNDITSFEKLREFLTIHFGDYRNEEFTAAELDHLKIMNGETHSDFCNRIRVALYILISKVNKNDDEIMRQFKIDIYKKKALNVFLFNLPTDIVRIVRLRSPQTLEEALGIVLEETSFYENYQIYNKSGPIRYGINASSNLYGNTGIKYSNTSQSTLFGAQQSNVAFPAAQVATGFGAAQTGSVSGQSNPVSVGFGGNSQPGALFGVKFGSPAPQVTDLGKTDGNNANNFSVNK
ncbi:uncharacterized protein ACR2FA_011122 [Aphomia sociella]